MTAYLPTHAYAVVVVAFWIVLHLVAGRALLRGSAATGRSVAWSMLLASTLALHWGLPLEPPGFRMLAFVVVGLTGMKLVVIAQCRIDGSAPLSTWQWLRFAVGWLGMRPAPFGAPRRRDLHSARALLFTGLRSLLAGLLVLATARVIAGIVDDRIVMVLVLLGASLVLHFGLCNVLAGIWRARGVAVEPLFRAPTRATSLTEFWGRRWNLAFCRMTQVAVYRPVAARLGRPVALGVAFVFSGVLHEMAISLPVRAGYGGPLAYFAVQAVLMQFERLGRARGIVVSGRWGRTWTIAGLVAPMPWLFHAPFIRGVLFPLIGLG